jgi:hypothetical protein
MADREALDHSRRFASDLEGLTARADGGIALEAVMKAACGEELTLVESVRDLLQPRGDAR